MEKNWIIYGERGEESDIFDEIKSVELEIVIG